MAVFHVELTKCVVKGNVPVNAALFNVNIYRYAREMS